MRKPYEPHDPSPAETTKCVVLGVSRFLGDDTEIVLSSLPEGTETVSVTASHDDDETDICLEFTRLVPLDDAEQATANNTYEFYMQAFAKNHARFVEENKVYEAWLAQEQRNQYDALKKIYEPAAE